MNAIVNTKIIGEQGIVENHAVLFDDKVRAILPNETANLAGMDVIDGHGLYLSPGFIDIHKHGAYNYDFMDARNEEALALLARLPETGVSSLYPTTMSMGFPDVRRAMEAIGQLMETSHPGTQVLGCHMEGPFLSPDWGGAQPREFIVPADYALVEGLEHVVKLVTVAPEERGNMDFIRRCVQAGIRVSLGHTLAHYEDSEPPR